MEILFDEIINRSGLVRIEEDRLSFRHLLLQEFFAGRGVPSPEYLTAVVGQNWWMRAIVFYFGERPGDQNALAHLQQSLGGFDGTDLYQAAVTIGLAVQACYLTRTQDKTVAMEWVVRSMASTTEDILEDFGPARGSQDAWRFVLYYLYGRDAVATKMITEVADRIAIANAAEGRKKGFDDLCLFWCLAGLIESRHLEKAEELLARFNPDDQRLLLALDMGAFYVQHAHITTPAQKRAAKDMRARIAPKIPYLRAEAMKEFKGIILELRSDGVKALDPPAEDDTLSERG